MQAFRLRGIPPDDAQYFGGVLPGRSRWRRTAACGGIGFRDPNGLARARRTRMVTFCEFMRERTRKPAGPISSSLCRHFILRSARLDGSLASTWL
jgi:hypothetical protein